MTLNTHLQIDTALSGKLTKLEEGYAEVLLHTTKKMTVDTQGLVHGGFVFSAADYAAMCAVNDPYVVLGASNIQFVAPVKAGGVILVKARIVNAKGKKRSVAVEAFSNEKLVFQGTFTTFILEKHVLEK